METQKEKSLQPELVLFLLWVGLYVFTLNRDFIYWGDIEWMFPLPEIQSPFQNHLLSLFSHMPDGELIPFPRFLWWLTAITSKTITNQIHPSFFHVLNLVVHLFSSLLIFRIIKSLYKSNALSLGTSLTFLIHPISSNTVAWASRLPDLCAALFMLLGIYSWLLSRTEKQRVLISTVFFILALLSKPYTIIFPFLLYFWTLNNKNSKKVPLRWVLIWTLFSMAFYFVNYSSHSSTTGPPLWLRPLVFFDCIYYYLYKFMLPLGNALSFERTFELIVKRSYLLVTCPLMISLSLWVFKQKNLDIQIAFYLAILCLLPYSSFYPTTFQSISLVALPYCYFALIFISLGCLLYLRKKNWLPSKMRAYLIIFALFLTSVYQITKWKNTPTLLLSNLQNYPNSKIVQEKLGDYFFLKKEFTAAAIYYSRVYNLDENEPAPLSKLGITLLNLNQTEKGLKALKQAVKIAPQTAAYHLNYALGLKLSGQESLSQKEYEIAASLTPKEAIKTSRASFMAKKLF